MLPGRQSFSPFVESLDSRATPRYRLSTEGDVRKTATVVLISLAAAACSGDAASTTLGTSPPATTTSEAVSTTEVPPTTLAETGAADSPLVIVAIDFEAGTILIRNDGAADYDLAGHFLCNRPAYAPLPAEVLASGEIIEVDTSVVGLSASGGELGLYTSADFGNADDIIRYVQWGSEPHGRTSVAVEAGVWAAGEFIDNAGGSIESAGSNPVSTADWSTG